VKKFSIFFIEFFIKIVYKILFTKIFLSLDNLSQDDMKEDIVTKKSDMKIKKLGYKKLASHYLKDEIRNESKNVKLTAAAYHRESRILVVGFDIGLFYLYEMPHVNMIHSLRYSNIFYF